MTWSMKQIRDFQNGGFVFSFSPVSALQKWPHAWALESGRAGERSGGAGIQPSVGSFLGSLRKEVVEGQEWGVLSPQPPEVHTAPGGCQFSWETLEHLVSSS